MDFSIYLQFEHQWNEILYWQTKNSYKLDNMITYEAEEPEVWIALTCDTVTYQRRTCYHLLIDERNKVHPFISSLRPSRYEYESLRVYWHYIDISEIMQTIGQCRQHRSLLLGAAEELKSGSLLKEN